MSDGAGCAGLALGLFVAFAVLMATCDRNDSNRRNGQFEERCRARGGYWLADSITVDTVRTRCIAPPQPINLTTPERTP